MYRPHNSVKMGCIPFRFLNHPGQIQIVLSIDKIQILLPLFRRLQCCKLFHLHIIMGIIGHQCKGFYLVCALVLPHTVQFEFIPGKGQRQRADDKGDQTAFPVKRHLHAQTPQEGAAI